MSVLLIDIVVAETWRCPNCVKNQLEPDPSGDKQSQRLSSAPHIARDLLPAHSDASGPGTHSIFNTLIIDEDPMDGSRSLRKRKSFSNEMEDTTPVTRKRQKLTPSQTSHIKSPVALRKTTREVDRSASVNAAEQTAEQTAEQAARPSRPRRTRKVEKDPCTILTKKPGNITLAFHLDATKMGRILNSRPKPRNRRVQRPPKPPPPAPPIPVPAEPPQTQFAPVPPASHVSPFYSFHDRENDELKSKPYGGILSEADADTSKTLPLAADREKFESARQRAEEDWIRKVTTSEESGEAAPRASQKVSGPPSQIKCINFGGYEIETWYAAPYPEEYSRNRVLYICEFCLKYMNSDFVAWRHKLKCPAKHPPGDEIYRDGSISVFEVDGRKHPVYCQNLCLLAKLFLGSKTLYYDVEPFLFYIMTELDDLGCHFVGYFSKEKRPSSSNNVSCILTLPTHQRKGYGNLLIDFSYLLTRVERKAGSPEKPLSDMGLVSYRNYWRLVLSYLLRDQKTPLSVVDISERTGMTADDIVSGLESLRALVRDPVTKTYALRLDYAYFEECISNWEAKGYVKLNPDALVWTPYVMGRSNQSHYDRGPLHTVAPREDPEAEEVAGEGKVDNTKNGKGKGETLSNGHADAEAATTPYDAQGISSTRAMSVDENVPGKTNGCSIPGAATTPAAKDTTSIPPTRYVIHPPIHGTTTKRRPGRPFGRTGTPKTRGGGTPATATRTSSRNTPRRASALGVNSPTPAGLGPVRRGRSSRYAAETPPTNGDGEVGQGKAVDGAPPTSSLCKSEEVNNIPPSSAPQPDTQLDTGVITQPPLEGTANSATSGAVGFENVQRPNGIKSTDPPAVENGNTGDGKAIPIDPALQDFAGSQGKQQEPSGDVADATPVSTAPGMDGTDKGAYQQTTGDADADADASADADAEGDAEGDVVMADA